MFICQGEVVYFAIAAVVAFQSKIWSWKLFHAYLLRLNRAKWLCQMANVLYKFQFNTNGKENLLNKKYFKGVELMAILHKNHQLVYWNVSEENI